MEVDSWVISDTHFGHKNVITYDSRPFKDVAEMDEALIENWNSVVKPGDTIYHLGDFAFYSEDKVCGILERLNGNKILILGNHDKVMRSEKVRSYFKLIVPYLEVYQDKQLICMFHYPIAEFNKSHHGSFHVHGHCVDYQTEILTTDGFKFRKDIKINDNIYSYNVDNSNIELDTINLIHDIDYTGKVYNFDSRSQNMRITSDHNVIYYPYRSNKAQYKTAKDFFQECNRVVFIHSGVIEKPPVFTIKEYAALYAVIVADGSIKKETSLCRIKVSKQHKITFIKDLLEKIGIDYKLYTYPDNDFHSYNFYMPTELMDWNIKGMDQKLVNLNAEEFASLLDGYAHSDGCKNGNGIIIYTAKKDEIDFLQHCAFINGYSSTSSFRHHGFGPNLQYQVSIYPKQYINCADIKKHLIIEDVENEPFWCITSNNKNWVMRRNGKVFVTGNCHGNYKPPVPCRIMDVGAPCINYTPINLKEVIKRLEKFPVTAHH